MCSYREVLKEVHRFFQIFPILCSSYPILSFNKLLCKHLLSINFAQFCTSSTCEMFEIQYNRVSRNRSVLQLFVLVLSTTDIYSTKTTSIKSVKPLERMIVANMQSGLQNPDKTRTWLSISDVCAVLDKWHCETVSWYCVFWWPCLSCM